MTTPELLQATTQIAAANGVPQLIHVAETLDETEALVAESALRPVRWLQEHGLLEQPLVAAHCVHVNAEEIHLMSRYGVGVAHNPTSNLKLASGIAPVAEMLRRGVHVGIGTDGCASNNDLDMFEEMRLAALLPKVVTGSPVAVPAEDALAMATIEGAKAIGMDPCLDRWVGKRADAHVAEWCSTHPAFSRRPPIYSRLACSSGQRRASCVCHGRNVVRDGQVLSVDLAHVLARAQDLADEISQFFVERETSVLEKLVDIAPLEQRETFEVQAKGVLRDEALFRRGMEHPEVHHISHTSRDQFDTYFIFADPDGLRLRYREDQVLQEDGSIDQSQSCPHRTCQRQYQHSVVLSRSGLSAGARPSLLQEYCPGREIEISSIEKYHIRYRGLDFAVNLDNVRTPNQPAPMSGQEPDMVAAGRSAQPGLIGDCGDLWRAARTCSQYMPTSPGHC